jgi:hypothetical protein
MVQNTQLPLPKAHKIIPEIVARWNRSKGRVDEMTRYLDAMNFPLPKGTPKQQLVMREFKKMAINVRFIMKHCFPLKPAPSGKGYGAIQLHHKHMKTSMRDVLFELASTYKLMNPIQGVVPGSPFRKRQESINTTDPIDEKIALEQSGWMKEAITYVKERITPDSRYKLRKFIEDEKLNRIRLDATLFHIPKSDGSYVHVRTGRRTKKGDNARERIAARSCEEDEGEETMKKVRRCPPRCIVCCATHDPKNKDAKIAKTTIYCSVCLVSLCTKRIDNRRTTCFERFHQIQNLSDLQATKSPSSTKGSACKKRKQTVTD